jgi:BirA family biotin operon repressor/biotin-[acetyl-CoA-carboxylase] ligase
MLAPFNTIMNTQLVGISIIHLSETDSTNKAIKNKLIQEKVPEGLVVSTDYQTLGRGQFGNSWESAAGLNLLFSTVFYPKFLKLNESYRLTMSVCLGICDFLAELSFKAEIKWPNDILIDGKKLSGTLLESSLNSRNFEYCVVGIGLNVNQVAFANSMAVSLRQMSKQDYPLSELYPVLFRHLSKRYLHLKEDGQAQQQREFNQRLYGNQHRVPIIWQEKEHWVFCRGVDPQGNLLVEFNDGSFQLFRHKEISFLLKS